MKGIAWRKTPLREPRNLIQWLAFPPGNAGDSY